MFQGVACTQLAFYLQEREGVDCKDRRFVELRSRAAREFLEARRGVRTCNWGRWIAPLILLDPVLFYMAGWQ